MNIADVIKWEMNTDELSHRFKSDSLRLGSQLVVYPGQTAFFVKGGQITDTFTSGTYTIKSENIPILGKLMNIPFDGKTPFKAEVWFVNQTHILDNKWGTSSHIYIEDPLYKIIVPVRAFGQYGFYISNPSKFLEAFVGNMSTFTTARMVEYFKGIIVSKLTTLISEKLCQEAVSVININTYADELSEHSHFKLNKYFSRYGVTLTNFTIMSISVKDDDDSFRRLKEAKDSIARINVMGEHNYKMERSFNVLDKAAANTGGIMGTAIDFGAGLTVGGQVGQIASQHLNINPSVSTPPLPNISYFLVLNGESNGPYSIDEVKSMQHNHIITSDTLIWRQGMESWQPIRSLSEFHNHLMPPPIPKTI